ncbi:MAG TPA: FmdB family zinc ribbon protein [Acidimicrobiales bacterium]|nr:FmdB family zinc ribbon protein [Acidimicrobiales bacterium]
MPTYEYRCEHCEQTFDVFQSFTDNALTACPTCGNPVRKVYGNVGVVFKGSGFYKNDSRPKEPAKSTSENGSSPKESSDSSSSGTTTKAPASDGAKKDSASSGSDSKKTTTPKAPV